MIHHLGLILLGGAAVAAFVLPSACNPARQTAAEPSYTVAAAPPAAPVAKADFDGSAIIADQARRYVADLYSPDAERLRAALVPHAGMVGVSSGQLQSALADNRARAPVKDVVIVRQEVENVPPKGQSGSVWFAILRADGSTQTGRLSAWRRHADNWRFTLTGF